MGTNGWNVKGMEVKGMGRYSREGIPVEGEIER